MASFYDLIDVSPKASAEEIRAACLRLVEIHLADKNFASSSSQASFKQLEAAFEVLLDPEKRARYDRGLMEQQVIESRSAGVIDKRVAQLALGHLRQADQPKSNGLFNFGVVLTLIGIVGLIYPLFGAQNRILYAVGRGTDINPTVLGLLCLIVGVVLIFVSRSRS